jgi:excisionase family DNA binding protein
MSERTENTDETNELFRIVSDPARLREVDPQYLPILLTQLGALQVALASRLIPTTKTVEAHTDALLTVHQAAERLCVSPDWLYRRTRSLPFVVRVGRHVRFSDHGIDRFIRGRIGR